MKTPISYYGGKQKMVEYILPLLETEHTVYTELFFGGGAVFFAKRKSPIETINDQNGNVVNFYECVKMRFAELKPLIEASIISREQYARALGIYRYPKNQNKIMRAWAFWYVTNFSYACKPGGGLRYSNYSYFSASKLLARKKGDFNNKLLARIEDATIENRDALHILRSRNVPVALHYLDPPYPECDQGHYSGYSITDFTNLLEACEGITGKFILSSYHYPVLDEFVSRNNWHQISISKPALHNTLYKGTEKKVEVLTLNFTPTNQTQMFTT